jgi:type IV pilus assembly protein PilC
MTIYEYKAKNREGEIYKRTREVSDRAALYASIREEHGSVISIKEVRASRAGSFFSLSFMTEIRTHEKIIFAKNLGMMIRAGLSVTRALAVMEKQAKRRAPKKLFAELMADVSRGQAFSDSMKNHPKTFSPLFISMARAGEESGNLAESLLVVSSQMEKSYLLTKKVRGALIYPGVILSVMMVIGVLLLIFMVPTLTETFEGLDIELPLSTRLVIITSDFFVQNTLLVISAMLLAIFMAVSFIRSRPGKSLVDIVSIRLPVIGTMIKEVEAARTARTLSSLLSSGVEIVVALDVTTDVIQNHLYKRALEHTRSAIEKGRQMSSVIAEYEELYPPFVAEMILVGEETGKISEMFGGVADFYEEEVDQKTKNLSTIIEPVLMVIIGAAVGFFAISMLAPTYSLVDNF